jgi:hypothetical protein
MKITKNELKEIIQEVADEMGLFEGLTKAQEKLPEPLKKAILKKQGNSEVSDEKEDVDEGLTKAQEKLPEPLKKAILKKQESDGVEDESDEDNINEGNAWGAAIKKAREENLKEFEFNGKKYKLTEKKKINEEEASEFTGIEDVDEGNAFGAAVTKAKEDGEDEFEVDGKTYKVREDVCPSCGDDPCVGEGSCSEEGEDDVEEGNAFGNAVTKAKENGDTEFEVDGKKYKVRENWSKITLSEKLDRILGNRKIL